MIDAFNIATYSVDRITIHVKANHQDLANQLPINEISKGTLTKSSDVVKKTTGDLSKKYGARINLEAPSWGTLRIIDRHLSGKYQYSITYIEISMDTTCKSEEDAKTFI